MREECKVSERGVREGIFKVGEGGSYEKDLRLIGRKFDEGRGNMKGTITEFNLGGERWKGETEARGGRERQRWSKERVSPVGLILIRLHG